VRRYQVQPSGDTADEGESVAEEVIVASNVVLYPRFYEFMAIDTAGSYSAHQLWHVCDRLFGPKVFQLQQPPTPLGTSDLTRWMVVVKANVCLPWLREKTRLKHAEAL
jgi:hypothetical protein